MPSFSFSISLINSVVISDILNYSLSYSNRFSSNSFNSSSIFIYFCLIIAIKFKANWFYRISSLDLYLRSLFSKGHLIFLFWSEKAMSMYSLHIVCPQDRIYGMWLIKSKGERQKQQTSSCLSISLSIL